jgi:6-pyruvoyltetrahydropterin/6-carboxytetrahydropterin synthase
LAAGRYKESMNITLTKTFHFEAAHTLPNVPPDHQCARMHGHSYKVEVSVTGPVGAESGWVMDHAEISKVVKPLIARLDHRYLNDIPGLENPTFEQLAGWLWRELQPHLPQLSAIEIHETPTSRCVYRGD